ncbi:MAG: sn-glycerol-1-phosphate dehydrogenase [Treponema sp.]|jgi:glycerol-1-phosphate dehydrogenase [NAD(P)+]|nr:sn-glycerol-1-phosphate dehydrogenase [Treponema sp.]
MDTQDNHSIPTLADCLKAADETQELLLKKDALGDIPALLDKYFSSSSVCLVADENTYQAAGKKVREILDRGGINVLDTYIFPGEPRLHAEYSHVKTLVDRIAHIPGYKDNPPSLVPIAIGAGTLNDLVKRASFELKLPYLCVPTAASVDGFTAFGAALLLDGVKQTLPCTAPRVLAADTEVLAASPAYLSSSGFGDLASKIVAGTDWLIAEKAGTLGAPAAEPMDATAWNMIQPGLLDTLHRSIKAAQGDRDAVNTLFGALAVTGFSMQYFKSSRPVSGSEHLFSHVWEMEDLSVKGVPVTHGHKVAIGTLAASAFTEIFFASPEGPPPVPKGYKRPTPEERKAEVNAAFQGSRAREGVVNKALEKLMDEKTARRVDAGFRDSWGEIREGVLKKLLPYGELKALMEEAGCPVKPEAINLTRNDVIATARRAQMMRNKYCIMDLAWDMGVFEEVLSRLEASAVYLR